MMMMKQKKPQNKAKKAQSSRAQNQPCQGRQPLNATGVPSKSTMVNIFEVAAVVEKEKVTFVASAGSRKWKDSQRTTWYTFCVHQSEWHMRSHLEKN
jgi:hypothetical protein